MRLTLLCASSALAASLLLSACSAGGNSQAIPGGSQSAMRRHSGSPQIYAVGARHQTSCPSSYYECLTVRKGSPATQEWCIIYSGTSDCTDVYPGTWTWSATVSKVKGKKKAKRIKASFSPNPGNPTTLTVSTKSAKSSHGKVKYVVTLGACNSVSSCVGPVLIGIIVS